MPMPRTTPLAITIAPGDGRSIAGQIVDGIRRKVSSGALTVGAQLPSVRGLAQQLAVNPNTVSKAYGELVAGGWLISRAGMGLYVAAPARRARSRPARRRHRGCSGSPRPR